MNEQSTATAEEWMDLGEDLCLGKTTRRTGGGGGTWVGGTLNGHRFEALVFPEPAEVPEYEIPDSRISKLWIQRIANQQVVYNWDRGLDIAAVDAPTAAIVDFLAAGLAESVYGQ